MGSKFPKEYVDFVVERLREKMARGTTFEEATEQLLKPQSPLEQPIPPDLLEAATSALKKYEAESFPETGGDSLTASSSPVSWLDQATFENGTFWPPLREYMEHEQPYALAAADTASTRIVKSLRPPMSDSYSTKGLVLGYVQSGKTTNFISVLAKAADAGYKFFIVLSGITNNLRKQTQERIDSSLIHDENQWIKLTTPDSDFSETYNTNASSLLASKDKKLIAVVKKNSTVLRKLNHFLRSAGTQANCPILVIDDEADQASINVGDHDKHEQSVINNQITELLSHQRSAYIAYTATPFANLLINPNEENDLYPKDFIHSLPKPEGYFGSEELFGREPLTDSDHDSVDGLPVIRIVPDDEADALRPKRKIPLEEQNLYVPDSLVEAMRWFFLATAARHLRGQDDQHSSMLIHTTMLKDAHEETKDLIRAELKRFVRELDDPVGQLQWCDLWKRENDAIVKAVGNADTKYKSLLDAPRYNFEELLPELSQVLHNTKLVTDNSVSEERLSYSEEDPTTVIAIGGNTLARGLTLEGLVSSYFVRASNAIRHSPTDGPMVRFPIWIWRFAPSVDDGRSRMLV
ncbi:MULTISPECIES: Z1 domain-containing protein [unclassified Corynebacterium]|uniref:Z1 domain-containing protein n=1 Tax=unclassified Corynebacterium TaxID=2624378 RepID=UPI00124DEF83|nr:MULTISPECIES: Z1 domain-containing protein [unclassified Corynebacterium]